MNNLEDTIKNQSKEESKSVIRCCRYCSNFYMTDEGNYTLFECSAIPFNIHDPYNTVLPDIGWDDYSTTVSKYCPLNKKN